MGYGTLTIIALASVIGLLPSLRSGWGLPIVLGELLAGMVLGVSGLNWLHSQDPIFTFLANIGFALVMFVAGSRVPVRDPALRRGIRPGTLRAVAVGVIAAPLGLGIAALFNTGNGALYAVLLAASSSSLILPIVDSLKLRGPAVSQLLPQVAISDASCILVLPLVIDPAHALRSALGACAVIASSVVVYIGLRKVELAGTRKRIHRISARNKFTIELRFSLVILFSLAAVAVATHVSVMLAGFGFGLVVSAIGQPRRLAKQLFAITEGFLGPLFFIWLGASLDIRGLGQHPSVILLGLALGVGAMLTKVTMRFTGQPLSIGALACAQIGVPVAAATLGTQLNLLEPGEAPALILGALVTIAIASVAGGTIARHAAPEAEPAASTVTILATGTGAPIANGIVLARYEAVNWTGAPAALTWPGGAVDDGGGTGPQELAVAVGGAFASLAGVPLGSRVLMQVLGGTDSSSGRSSTSIAAAVDLISQTATSS